MRKKPAHPKYALCVKNSDCPDLEKRKVYKIIHDDKAEREGYIRVVDESGEDYLYPDSYFVRIQLPQTAESLIGATG